MIYPEKIKAKKSDQIMKQLISVSVGIAIILVLINKLTTPTIPWAALANAGILYSWVVVIYAIKKNINIAGHVLLQLIALSSLTIYIDYVLGMMVLTIVSYKKYMKYAMCQLVIVLLSMLPVLLVTEHIVEDKTLSIVATGISVLNFLLCLMLAARDIKEAILRKFHI